MIKNSRQLTTAKKQVASFAESIASLKSKLNNASGIEQVRLSMALDAAQSMQESIAAEIAEYENLTKGNLGVISIRGLHDLPRALIKARIAHGWTQKELAAKLGVKPQQVQRWEHEEYERTGFDRLEQVAEALGISRQIRIQPRVYGGPFIMSAFPAQLTNPSFGKFAAFSANTTVLRGTAEVRFSDNDGGSGCRISVFQNKDGFSMRMIGVSPDADGIYKKEATAKSSTSSTFVEITEDRKHA